MGRDEGEPDRLPSSDQARRWTRFHQRVISPEVRSRTSRGAQLLRYHGECLSGSAARSRGSDCRADHYRRGTDPFVQRLT
jgi:hypothetical protein